MEIKKVLNLSKEEFDALIKAGEIIGSVNKSLETKEADEVSDSAKNLIKAINDVSKKVLGE